MATKSYNPLQPRAGDLSRAANAIAYAADALAVVGLGSNSFKTRRALDALRDPHLMEWIEEMRKLHMAADTEYPNTPLWRKT